MRAAFLGGVPGAGKTTLSRRLGEAILGINAGRVIRENLSPSDATIIVPNDAREADRFQRILVDLVPQLFDERGTMLIDGHFALPLRSGDIYIVREEIFRELSLVHLFVLDTNLRECADRLNAQPPPWWEGELSVLSRLRDAELKNAEHVGRSIGVPLAVDSEPDELLRLLRQSLAGS